MTSMLLLLGLTLAQLQGLTSSLPVPGGGKEFRAVSVGAASIRLDGRLDDAVWRAAQFRDDFLQKEPVQGGAPSGRTEVAFVYDDEALYVGARMRSPEPDAIVRTTSRRDGFDNAERLIVSLDTYHDRRTAYSFVVTAGGTRSDWYHPEDQEFGADPTFNPVWQAEVAFDSTGWSAEMRIPFSQLRFHRESPQVFGVNVNRFIPARNEDVFWIVVPRDETGWASRMGALTGLEGVQPTRPIELLPYVASDARLRSASLVDPADPFAARREAEIRAGGDIKVGLGANLTLEGTFNPDFGQVEADPAEVNLSAFETFFEERRPFFTEGAQLLEGGGPAYFYSRRIGAAPRGAVTEPYVDAPATTTILGATKLTGRLPSGLSIGGLAAVTGAEHARVASDGAGPFARRRVEPLAVWGATRLQQEFGPSASTVGFALSGVRRDLSGADALSDELAHDAIAGGADWQLRFDRGAWEMGGWVGASRVAGTATALASLQQSSTHYFQRPDVEYVDVDSSRTALSGWTAGLRARKHSGRWRFTGFLRAYSPDFEINDVGQLRRADRVESLTEVFHTQTTPGSLFRRWEVGAFTFNDWNFGGTWLNNRIGSWFNATLHNYVNGELAITTRTDGFDDTMTRGGPLVGIGGFWNVSLTLQTNPGAPVGASGRFEIYNNPRSDWEGWEGAAGLFLRPAGAWSFQADLSFQNSVQGRQYVTDLPGGPPATFGRRYVLSRVHRDDFVLRLRGTWVFAPDVSLEVYAEPFVASRRFFGFGEVPAPRAYDLREYGANGTTIETGDDGTYRVTDGGDTFSFANPDFTRLSFRSNVVFRWEWRPGSTLFVVWQQDRATEDLLAPVARPWDLGDAFGSPGGHVFALKATYWFTLGA